MQATILQKTNNWSEKYLNDKALKDNRWYLFGMFAALYVGLVFVINDIIITDPSYFTGGNARSVELFRKVYSVIYIISPVYMFLKITLIAILIKAVSNYFFNTELRFWQVFTLINIAEFILLLPMIWEVIWFLLLNTDYTMAEVDTYSLLSLYSLFNPEAIGSEWSFPLKRINPFELVYWFILTVGLVYFTQKTHKQSLKIIALSYGMGLLVIAIFRFIIFGVMLGDM